MNSPEARIIIGAAVIDDVLGLVILTVVSGLAAGSELAPLGVVRIFAVGVGFLVVAVLVGRYLAPRLFDMVVRMRVRYV
jgi:Kef-type K+ transport system membrane component KefB